MKRFTLARQFTKYVLTSRRFYSNRSIDDDIVIDTQEEKKMTEYTKEERKERKRDMRPREYVEDLPEAGQFFFRNKSIPSSPLIDPLEPHILSDAQYLFTLPSNMIHTCGSMDELPDVKTSRIPEVAIAGRSNVGKSSFVNALLGRELAVVSQTPGRTRRLNYFNLGEYAYIVDLPGYGFAQGDKEKIDDWKNLVLEYLSTRTTLKRIFMLIDARHGFFKTDLSFLDAISHRTTVQFVLTKCDMINDEQLRALVKDILSFLETKYPLALPIITPTSTRTGEGIEEARGWVYSATGLVERLLLLNSVERARAFSQRDKETKIELKQLHPDHPIFAKEQKEKIVKKQEKPIAQKAPQKQNSIIFGLEEF
jgi:GTP-binding protein